MHQTFGNNRWSLGGSFVVQKIDITSHILILRVKNVENIALIKKYIDFDLMKKLT